MIKVKDGYAKLIGATYNGSKDRVLLSNGGDHILGNDSDNIPLNDGTVNTNLNADLLDGYHSEAFIFHKKYLALSDLPSGTEGWYKIATITDSLGSPCIFAVRAYAHSSVIFTVSKGYGDIGNITVLQSCINGNPDYAHIKAARIISGGIVEILLNKPKSNSSSYVNISISAYNTDNVKLNNILELDTITTSDIDTKKFINKSILASNLEVDGIYALSSSTSTTLSLGTSGLVLKSGGNGGVYWDSLNYYTKEESDSRFYGATVSRVKNTVLAAPNGKDGVATFRSLVSADIPNLAISKITNLLTILDGKPSPYIIYNAAKTNTAGELLGCLLETDIKTDTNTMVTFRIEGNSYGLNNSILTTGQFYNYDAEDVILSTSAYHHGYNFGSIKVFCYNDYVHLWFLPTASYLSFIITVLSTNDSIKSNRVISSTNVKMPTSGVTRLKTIAPVVDSVSGGGNTWGSSMTVSINGTSKTLTLPSNPNTDYRVTQTVTTASNTSWRPFIVGMSHNDSEPFSPETTTDAVYATHKLKIQPSTGNIQTYGYIKLYSASGDSPHLIFQRGTAIDGTYDWDQYVTNGYMKFRYNNAGTWEEILSLYKGNSTLEGYKILHAGNSEISGNGGSTWGSSITVKINGTSKTLTIPSNPAASSKDWFTALSLTKTITVEGNSSYWYPVVITCSTDKQRPTFISIWKDLGTTTPSIEGNHTNGTSSLWLLYEMRNTTWDGNGGYIKTWYKSQGYGTLVAHTRTNTKNKGSLIVWLRGGTCTYNISCTNTFSYNIYYSNTNIDSSSSDYVDKMSSVDNGGIYTSTYLGYGNIYGNATTATTANKVANALTFTAGNFATKTYNGSTAVTVNVPTTGAHIGLGNVLNTAFYKRSTTVNGTPWNMAGTTNGDAFTIYAPTTSGSGGDLLISDGEESAPVWTSPGNVTVGAASKADKLSVSRTISLSGAVTGSASFNGSNNITIATTNDSSVSGGGSSWGSAITVKINGTTKTLTIPGKPTIPTVTDYYWANVKVSSTESTTTTPTFGNTVTLNSTGNVILNLTRTSKSSWRFLNDSDLKIQNNYTTAVTTYFDVVKIAYNTGNISLKGSLTLLGTTSDNARINFSRGSSSDYPYNYITAPTGGIITMEPGGLACSSTTGYLFTSSELRPGVTNTYSLGTSTLMWKNIYATAFISGTGTSDFSAGTIKFDTINIPTTSGGTTYGKGTNGQVLKSNGSTVYWASDNNTDTKVTLTLTTTANTAWRPIILGYTYSDTYEEGFSDYQTNTNTAYASHIVSIKPNTGALYSTTLNNNNFRFNSNLAYYTTSNANKTGIFVIKLPTDFNGFMNIYEIDVFEYNSYGVNNENHGHSKIIISGYNYKEGQAWVNYSYKIIGSFNKKVRLSYNGSKCCILLGETTTTWKYPQIYLSKVYAGFLWDEQYYKDWSDEYTIDLVTSETGYTKTVTANKVIQNFGNLIVGGETSSTDISILFRKGTSSDGYYDYKIGNFKDFTNATGFGIAMINSSGTFTKFMQCITDTSYNMTEVNFRPVVSTKMFRALTTVDSKTVYCNFHVNDSGTSVIENNSGAFYINSKNLISLKANLSNTDTSKQYQIVLNTNGTFYPNTTISLGTSSLRWSYVYATHLNAEGGSFYTNANGAYWTSDVRLKTNIIKARNLDIADLLVEFDWKDSGDHSWGYIAQDLLEVLPEAVSYNADTDRYSVNYNVAHSAAIASLTARIKELEEKLKKYGLE